MSKWPSREGHPRSKAAIERWEEDSWSSAITFYEDFNMPVRKVNGKLERRVVSPIETERLLDFPTDWTKPANSCNSKDEQNSRKNSVGNAFAVPVIHRILLSLALAIQGIGANGMDMWADTDRAAPYHSDSWDAPCPR